MAFYAVEGGWGEERADWRMGQICALLANVHRDPKRSAPFKATDFMPRLEDDPNREREDVAEQTMKTLDGMIAQQARKENGDAR